VPYRYYPCPRSGMAESEFKEQAQTARNQPSGGAGSESPARGAAEKAAVNELRE
jgi:hypothetical protein